LVVRWRYNRNQDKFIEHTATFTNESVSTSRATTDIRLTWDQLASIVATPRGLLFIIPPRNIWFWLPQHLFEGNSHRDIILELATEPKFQFAEWPNQSLQLIAGRRK
jgi:hypothetical protein